MKKFKDLINSHIVISISLFTFTAIVLLLLVIIFFINSDNKHGSADKATDEKAEIEIYGDGDVLVTFEATIPEWTPEEDKIYVRIDDYWWENGQGIPMTKTSENTYIAKFRAESNQELKYRYNRNNYDYATDEQLEPEKLNAARTANIGFDELTISDTVTGWRWLYNPYPTANLSDFKPEVSMERKNEFVIGVSLLDFYNPLFTEYLPDTLDRLKARDHKYIGIAYSPHLFVSADPLKLSEKAINSHTPEELDYMISEIGKRDMKVMLMPSLELNPDTLDELDKVMTSTHDDAWYREYVRLWKEEMVEVAKYAKSKEVSILAPSNFAPFLGSPTATQKQLLNTLTNEGFKTVKKEFDGIVTTDYYDDGGGIFDYYKQMDLIGDKWWGGIADSRETTLEGMKAKSEQVIKEKYQPIYDKYKKPIFLNQLAFASHDGGAGAVDISNEGPDVAEWYPKTEKYPLDFQEQADAFEAVFQAIYDDPIFNGVFAFGYGYWDFHAKSPSIRSKPSEDVWEKWTKLFTHE